jgi:phosphoglycolate phosphatase
VAAVPYRLVLFDFDGTLADSLPWFIAAFNELAGPLRFRRLGPDEVERTRAMGPRQVMRLLGVPWWKVPLIAQRMRRQMAAHTERIRPFDGVPEMLRRLAEAGLEMGVVTSNAERNVRAILGDSAAHFRHWKCEASLFGKPAQLRALLRETRAAPREVLCVGDELRDAEAARAAGLDFAAVTWGYATPEALRATRPALVFDSVADIAAQLGHASRW